MADLSLFTSRIMIAFFAAWQNLEEKCAGEGLMASNTHTLHHFARRFLSGFDCPGFCDSRLLSSKIPKMTNETSRPYKWQSSSSQLLRSAEVYSIVFLCELF